MRLNGVIRALETGEAPVTVFAPPTVDTVVALSVAPYDGIIVEAEHNAYDIGDLRDCLQYMLSRWQIVAQRSLSPAVTITRIPPNGGERDQWCIVWPHITLSRVSA